MLHETDYSGSSELGYFTVEDQRGPLETELRNCELEDETLAERAFGNMNYSEEAIEAFILGCDLYDKEKNGGLFRRTFRMKSSYVLRWRPSSKRLVFT